MKNKFQWYSHLHIYTLERDEMKKSPIVPSFSHRCCHFDGEYLAILRFELPIKLCGCLVSGCFTHSLVILLTFCEYACQSFLCTRYKTWQAMQIRVYVKVFGSWYLQGDTQNAIRCFFFTCSLQKPVKILPKGFSPEQWKFCSFLWRTIVRVDLLRISPTSWLYCC